jgi:predicted DNA-binding protein
MAGVSLFIPRETARKLSRLDDFLLDGSKSPFYCSDVPGQRHPDKTTLSVYLPRMLMQRLRRLAAERGETVTTVIEAMATAQTREVVLTTEDYEQIDQETRRAQSGRRPGSNPSAKGG